jgi:hypothetical protein
MTRQRIDANLAVTTFVKSCRWSVDAFTNLVKAFRRLIETFTNLVKVFQRLIETFTNLVKVSARADLYFHQMSESIFEDSLPFSLNIVRETFIRRSRFTRIKII